MKIKAKKDFDKGFYLMFCSCLLGFGTFIVLFASFLLAYFNETKSVLVTINEYGEAHIELFMFFLLFDFFIICLVYGYKRMTKNK